MDRQRKEVREYKDWGEGQVFDVTRRTPRNDTSYSAINMQVYDSGALGVRPWLKKWANTGFTPATNLNLSDDSCIQYRERTGVTGANPYGELYIYSVSVSGGGAAAYYYDFQVGDWASASGIGSVTLPNATAWATKRKGWGSSVDNKIGNSQADSLGPSDFIFLGQKKWDGSSATAIDWGNGTVLATITNSVFYRGRLWGWSQTEAGKNRLYYTDIDDYTDSTSALQYIDISASSGSVFIKGCWAVRDSLLINLSNDDWYAFTGTPDTGTLRYIGKYVSPSHGAAAVVLSNAVYFMAPNGDGVCMATPSGVDTVTHHNVKPWIGDYNWLEVADYRAIASPDKNAIHLVCYDATDTKGWLAIERVNELWYLCQYGFGDFVTRYSQNLGQLRDCATVNYGNAWAFVTYGSYWSESAGATLKEIILFTRDITLNRPSRSDDLFSDKQEGAAIGGNFSVSNPAGGSVRLSPYGPDLGEEVRVSKITVDFMYWKADTAVYSDLEMQLYIRTLNGPKASTRVSSAVYYDWDGFRNWNSDTTLPELDDTVNYRGAEGRYVYDVSMTNFYPDLFIELTEIRSLAINRIIVEYEVRPDNLTTRDY
jgi:hypothetical protein